MSFCAARSFLTVSSKLLSSSKHVSSRLRSGLSLCTRQPVGPQVHRGLTRSLWYMCNTAHQQNHVGSRPAKVTKMCGCCGLHTQGDKELADFLSEEIKEEIKKERNPTVSGFDVKCEGASVVFEKKSDNESVRVKFNINRTVDVDEDTPEYDNPEEAAQEPKMVSRPPFVVELNKGGNSTLAMECVFPSPEYRVPSEGGDEQNEQFEDVIEIEEVALLKGEWDEKVYCVSGNVMDGNMYEMLLGILEERGIDAEFIDQLVDFSTDYEHNKYVEFLQELKDFATTK